MTSRNVITWAEIEDKMKSMIYEFLDFDDEILTNFQFLEWLENAWKLLVKSGVVNCNNQIEYFQASLYCIALFCLYAEYTESGRVDCESFLDVAHFWGITIENLKQIIYLDEHYDDEHYDDDLEIETIELIHNIFQDVIAILIKNFGSRLKLFESIQKSIQIDENFFEEDDTFDQAEAEVVNEQITIHNLAERWEEIEGNEVRKATLKLACYFEGKIIDIEEVKPMINHGDDNFQTNRFKNMKYETISPKFLFSMDTFQALTEWEDYTRRTLSVLPIIYDYDKMVEYVEEPFNRLCYLVSAKLPSQLSPQPGDAKWNEAELEKKFSHFKLFYIRINHNYITFGYSKEIYRSIFLNVLQMNPHQLKKIIRKNLEKNHDMTIMLNNECFITKNELINLSTSQLSDQIAQFFLNHLDLILLATVDDKKTPLVNESKLNSKYSLIQCSQETGFTETQLTQWKNAINRKGQTIIQGPPGTGKTFIAERLAKHLISGGDGFSDIIQFHPAYTYEDFIEGLRPITENGQLTYSIVPGRFLEFCEKAEACEDTCVLIIDEINRANLSQVFGELMYLLDERENTERFITLASGKLFRIPTNVRIIGTMNTADRSIALVDNALRRRFAFIPISPNYELLQNYHNRAHTVYPVDKLIGIIKEVNQAINNKHYELGISFFLTKTLAEDIQDIWQMEIEPYLEEYFFDNQKKMDEFLWDKIKDNLSK